MPRVVFTPSGLAADIAEGTSILDAARQSGADIDSICGGRGICGRCQVLPAFGEFSKWKISSEPTSLTAPSPSEVSYDGRRPLVEGQRLGCMAQILGDIVIDVPEESQVHKQVVRKAVDLAGLTVDPVTVALYVELGENSEGEALEHLLVDAILTQHGRTVVVQQSVLRSLVAVSQKQNGAVTAAVHLSDKPDRVVAVWPGFVDVLYGVAIDIGSTTIAGHLCDLATGEVLASAGRMNPQIRFGEDLMSRVSYVMMNDAGQDELTSAIREAIADLVGEMAELAEVSASHIVELVCVGNPVMGHLFMGFDVKPLGQAPFPLAISDAVEMNSADLAGAVDVPVIYFGPSIAGHVGADTTAAILAERTHDGADWQLMIDVGTNAEIVLGRRGEVFAASSPTGPAFEGAQLTSGQRATAGAIERVRIDPKTLEPRFKVIGSELWSDDAGFAEAIGAVGVTGICGSGIIEVIAELYLAGIIDTDGVIDSAKSAISPRVVPSGRTSSYVLNDHDGRQIVITQNDVRAIQLAKAALRAGVDLLLEHAGIDQVDDVRLAGAFGSHISSVHALVLGLVPDNDPSRVRAVGNASGSGAIRALLSRAARRELEDFARKVIKIETATQPRFQELFVAAMAFPHKTATNELLGVVVELPARTAPSESGRGRRRSNLRKETPNE